MQRHRVLPVPGKMLENMKTLGACAERVKSERSNADFGKVEVIQNRVISKFFVLQFLLFEFFRFVARFFHSALYYLFAALRCILFHMIYISKKNLNVLSF